MNNIRKITYSKQNIIEKIYHKGLIEDYCGRVEIEWFVKDLYTGKIYK